MFSQLTIITKLWKASIIQAMEYRGSFMFSIVANFFDFIFGLLQYLVFFTAAKSIAGWDSDNMLTLYSVFMFIYSLQFIFLYPNIAALAEMVNTGGLDLLLSKPVDARLFILLRKISLEELGSLCTSIVLFIWLISKGAVLITAQSILLFLISIFSALTIVYSIYITLTALAIMLEKMEDASEFIWSLFSFCRYPTDIYPSKIKFLFFTFFPIAYISTVPAQTLSGLGSAKPVIYGLIISIVSLLISSAIWKKTIKSYTSAGG
ncbi:MAG: ABC-2 family transporter protein [Candidatus Riflebacteria bacterium]|nr:ABC-2 family transporter protein [Candidatus Riflebacteria bacterium]